MIINTSNHATDVKICQVPFTLFIFKIFIDTFSTSFTCTHGKDNSSCTCNSITAGIYTIFRCLTCFFFSNDTSSLIDFKTLMCSPCEQDCPSRRPNPAPRPGERSGTGNLQVADD